MTGKEMRKLIDTGICPNCNGDLREQTKVVDILSSGNCGSCDIHWDGWATPGNQQTEATLWSKQRPTWDNN